MRKRPVLFATLAVLLIGAGGATTVFYAGSAQRRNDRKAYLAYERAVVAPIGEARRVAQEMRTHLAGLRGAARPGGVAPGVVDAWRRSLAEARSDVVALEQPAFLRGVEAGWLAAIERYARATDVLARAALEDGEQALMRADDLFNRAAGLMQFHRRRLGLGATTQLPDPAATLES